MKFIATVTCTDRNAKQETEKNPMMEQFLSLFSQMASTNPEFKQAMLQMLGDSQ